MKRSILPRTIIRQKALGPSIGGGPASEMIDGDNDGKCREEGGKWVPCPPGVTRGSVLTSSVGGAQVFDLPKGGGIDRIKELPKKYREAMDRKMASYGLTKGMLKREARKAFKEASPELIARARTWYETVHMQTRQLVDDINARYNMGLGFEQAAGVIAAISPTREFGKNMRDAKNMIRVIAEDKPFAIDQDRIDTFKGDQDLLQGVLKKVKKGTIKPSDFTEKELGALAVLHPVLGRMAGKTGFDSVFKALHIARGASIDETLSGPKVRSFYSNIVNPNSVDRTTIDTWMYRVMTPPNHKFTLGKHTLTLAEHEAEDLEAGRKKKRPQDLFQSTPSGMGVGENVGLYPIFAEVLRELAEEYGMPPSALQAILWEVARTRAGYAITDFDAVFKELEL